MNRKKNYLEFVPIKNSAYSWKIEEDGKVVVGIPHKSPFDKIVQKLFHKPKVTYIHLDEMGSFVWPLIDGKTSILEIAKPVKAHFGKKADPLYERLAKYFKILHDNQFVRYQKGNS